MKTTRYLTRFLKEHCGSSCEFTSITVARDLCTAVHRDRFNLRNSSNYVLTLGDFQGGGIWQQGSTDEFAKVDVESAQGEVLQGYVMPVRNRIVKVDPKRLHRTMPWTGGPKWTVIAHTIGARGQLKNDDMEKLNHLAFPVYAPSLEAMSVNAPVEEEDLEVTLRARPWRYQLSTVEVEDEMMSRLWTRRALDEEEQLVGVAPDGLAEDYEGVIQANGEATEDLHLRETLCVHERWDEEQWLGLCRMTENDEETRGVETMLEELREPLKVVFTAALENYASRWAEAMHKEVKALLDAGALVPLSPEERASLEASGKLVALPAKGVFTAKPPDEWQLVDASWAWRSCLLMGALMGA